MSTPRKPYPGGVTGDEGALVAPSLTLTTAGVPQRRHDPRGFFNAVRWLVRTGSPRRCPPNDLPPWPAVSQQTRRWLAAGCFEAVVDDLRALLRVAAGRDPEPAAVVLGGRTPRSTRERGHRAGADGHKRTKGSKRHAAADTLGHLPAARSTPANAQERAQVEAPAAAVQEVSGDDVEPAPGRPGGHRRGAGRGGGGARHRAGGGEPAGGQARLRAAAPPPGGGALRRPGGAVPPPGQDHERLPGTVVGLHFVAFACPMLHRALAAVGARP